MREYAEGHLFGPYANGAKFDLINNYRGKYELWADKHEVDHTSKGQPMPLLGGTTPMVDDDDDVSHPSEGRVEDDRVCPFCNALDGTVTALEDKFFDKGDVLTVGDQKLDLSYDDIPSAPLHVKCRCTLLPVRAPL